MLFRFAFGFILSLVMTLHASAHDYPPDPVPSIDTLQDEILWLQEETFVTTATKTKELANKTGASVTIITRRDLQRMGARNLMDALKRVSGLGVQLTNIGLPSVEVRGVKTADSEKVLFLINGHSINNNLTNGGAIWGHADIPVDNIKQVEIVRGPGSALYGANAFVAVINIITQTGDVIDGSEVTVSTGSFFTRKLNIQLGDKTDDLALAANLHILDTNGLDKTVDEDGTGASGPVEAHANRYDFEFNLSSAHFTFQGKYLERESGPYVGISNNVNDESLQSYTEYFFDLAYQNKLTKDLRYIVKGYFDHFQANNFWELFSEGVFPDFPDGVLGSPTVKHDKTGVELQLTYEGLQNHKLLAGLLFEHQSQYDVRHFTNFDPDLPYQDVTETLNWNGNHRRDISAFYAQDIWDIHPDLRLIAGARYDKYSDFGESVNPRSSITWQATRHSALTIAYGEAFRAPSFGDLHNTNNPSITGNPDLDPEEIKTYELAVNHRFNKRTSLQITGFQNSISDIIQYVPSGGPGIRLAQNTKALKVQGVETAFDMRLRNGSQLHLNYTYQYPENKETDKREADVPMHKANGAFTYRHSKFLEFYTGLQYRGELGRAENDSRDKLGSVFTTDIAINFSDDTQRTQLTFSIYNLFDKNYVDPAPDASPNPTLTSDVPTPGRNFMLDLRYKI